MLILGSSERYLNSYVALCETQASDGTSSMKMKKSISLNKNVIRHANKGGILNFTKKLTGHIKYSEPTVPYDKFGAQVKLRQDPKIEIGTIDNL